MIRVTARYQLLTEDFDLVDQASDLLMDALVANTDVTDPDVAVSLTEHLLEIWLVLATDDVLEAIKRGTEALALAFATAGMTAQVFAHSSLIGPEAQA